MKNIFLKLTSTISAKILMAYWIVVSLMAICGIGIWIMFTNLTGLKDEVFSQRLPNLNFTHQISQEMQQTLETASALINAQSPSDALGLYQKTRTALYAQKVSVQNASQEDISDRTRQVTTEHINRLEILADENYDTQLELADLHFRREVIQEDVELAFSQTENVISNAQAQLADELENAIREENGNPNQAIRLATSLLTVANFHAQFLQLREQTISLSRTFDIIHARELRNRASYTTSTASLGLLQLDNPQLRTRLAQTLGQFQKFSAPDHELSKVTDIIAQIQETRRQQHDEIRQSISEVLLEQNALVAETFTESTRVADLLGQTIDRTYTFLLAIIPMVLIPACTIALVFLRHKISDRMKRLAITVNQIANGDTDALNPITGNDEITAISRRLEDFRRMTKQLLHSNANLERFAYVASHDLRSPMQAIHNLASWTLEDAGPELKPKHRENLEMLVSRVVRLENLSKDLLLYAKHSTQIANYDDFRLSEVVEDVIEISAQDAEIEFDIDVFEGPIFGAKTPIRQILLNLVSNSIKHHDKKKCRVKIVAEHLSDSFRLTVTDDGPGIEPKYHSRVLEPFATLQSRDDVEGSGLGLSIVDALVRAIDATFTLVSDPEKGRGTTIILNVPIPPETRQNSDLDDSIAFTAPPAETAISHEGRKYG